MSLDPADPSSIPAPVLVGAVGGSGTRVVARLLLAAGVFMGARRNEAEDSEPVMAFYATWLRRQLESEGRLDGRDREAAEADFRDSLRQHLSGHSDPRQRWGVKVPRNILALSFWCERFPGLRFVHVIRSGLDMAYSGDRNQLDMFGDLLAAEADDRPDPVRKLAYWRRVNLAAAAFGESHLAGRYLLLRFEDVCEDPSGAYAELCRFAGVERPATRPRRATRGIAPPRTIGRWREHPEDEIAELVSTGGDALRRFGYRS